MKKRHRKLKNGSSWFAAGNISIRLLKTDEGVVCTMYPKGENEYPLTACDALYEESMERRTTA